EGVERAKRDGNLKNFDLERQNQALKRELIETLENHKVNTKGLSTAQLDALNAKAGEFRAENEKERIENIQKRSFGGMKI
ncbi:recombinase, partial [Avibacterium avium]